MANIFDCQILALSTVSIGNHAIYSAYQFANSLLFVKLLFSMFVSTLIRQVVDHGLIVDKAYTNKLLSLIELPMSGSLFGFGTDSQR